MRTSVPVSTAKASGVVLALVVLLAGCAPEDADEPDDDLGADPPEAPAADEPPEPEPEPAPEPEAESDEPTEEPDDDPDDEPTGPDEAAVSAGHPAAVDAGIEVLEAGGNAVDAAIAAAFAVSVVEPFASGIGGGGQALVAGADADPQAHDYREVVPESGEVPASGTGVPGFAAGMGELHDRYAELSWDELVAPAVDLAEESTTSALLSERLAASAGRLPVQELPHLFPDGQPLEAGAPLRQEALADTLRTLRDDGPQALYTGELAEELAAAIPGLDGDSLEAYTVQSSEPPSGPFADYEVVGAAPPLPGSTLVQQLQIAEAAGAGEADLDAVEGLHAQAMSWRAARAHITWDLGDPAFTDVPTSDHTDPERNASIAEQIPDDALLATDPQARRGGLDPNTTHVTTVDTDGRVVSMTNTLTNFWGSGQHAGGFFLNNQLDRFAIGRSDANDPAPGRRSVSWSLPVLVLDAEGDPVLGIGTPGGERIPNVLTGVLVRWALHDEPLEEAVAAPRIHLEDDRLQVEQALDPGVAEGLLGLGYAGIDQRGSLAFGSVQALEIDGDEVSGARDERREADWRSTRP